MFFQLQPSTASNSAAPPVYCFVPEQISMMPELYGLPMATASQDQDLIKALQAKLAAQSKVIGEMKKNMILQERNHKNQMEIEKETQTVLRSRIAKLEATVKIRDQELKRSSSRTALSQELDWVKRSRGSLAASLKKDKERNAKLQSENLELKRKANLAEATLKKTTELHSKLAEEHTALVADIQLKKDQMLSQEELKLAGTVKEAYPNLCKQLYQDLSRDESTLAVFQLTKYQKEKRRRVLEQLMKEARRDMEQSGQAKNAIGEILKKYRNEVESMEESIKMEKVEKQEIELMP